MDFWPCLWVLPQLALHRGWPSRQPCIYIRQLNFHKRISILLPIQLSVKAYGSLFNWQQTSSTPGSCQQIQSWTHTVQYPSKSWPRKTIFREDCLKDRVDICYFWHLNIQIPFLYWGNPKTDERQSPASPCKHQRALSRK